MSEDIGEAQKIYNVTINRSDGNGNLVLPSIKFKTIDSKKVTREILGNDSGWAIFDPVGGSRIIVRLSSIVDIQIWAEDKAEVVIRYPSAPLSDWVSNSIG